jgi:hypothetical protein
MSKPVTSITLALLACAAFGVSSTSIKAQQKSCPALTSIDGDRDGTVDLAEAKAAAAALFDKLDADKDGTLDAKELKGRMPAGKVRANDADHDGTLDKAEYLTVVETRFKAADPDKDGTIDCKEAATKAGKTLLQALR